MMSPNNKIITCLMPAILLWATLCTPAVGKTIYVDDNADGANNGISWVDAYNFLQEALADANSAEKPVEIRVAQGIYRPNQGLVAIPEFDWRTTTFQLINGVTLKGGYAGTGEADPDARDVKLYETILSGDLNGDDSPYFTNNSDNSYHVVTASGTDEIAVLDGFTITAGNADSGHPNDSGGGISCIAASPIITRCVIRDNRSKFGAGISCSTGSSPTISNSTICYNSAETDDESRGGGLYADNSNPLVRNCIFLANQALPMPTGEILPGTGGGGICYNDCENAVVEGSTLTDNYSTDDGGAICCHTSRLQVTECAFLQNNSDDAGGGMYLQESELCSVKNSLFDENHATGYGGGIFYRDSTSLTIENCTISRNTADVGGGIRCSVNSTVGFIANSILWDNASPEGQQIAMTGNAVLQVTYSDITGGHDGVARGSLSTLIWGEGNIDFDPLLADPNNSNYHLKSQAGRWDPNIESWVKDDVTSLCIDAGDPNSSWQEELWPHGKRINMGVYGGTAQASMSLSDGGSRADCNNDGSVDARDLIILCKDWLSEGQPTAADINRDSVVNFQDFARLAANWLQDISEVRLVAHWKLDETDGDIAYDSAGNNDATVHNGVWDEGRINGALQFNGFNTYMDCGDSEALGPEQMTLTMWLRPEHMGGMRYILSRANKSNDDIDYVLTRHMTGELEFAVGQLGSDPVSILSIAQTPLNEWYHVAVCLNGSEASIYMNGQWDTYASYAQRVLSEGHRLVISSYQGSTRFFNGRIDDVRIYNQALSAEEIEALAR